VRERAAAALEVTARTPAGCAAMLVDGAVPSLVRECPSPAKGGGCQLPLYLSVVTVPLLYRCISPVYRTPNFRGTLRFLTNGVTYALLAR
jgi:hypothetical protein